MSGPWTEDMLGQYPMDSNAMVRDLDAERLGRMLAYVEEVAHDAQIAALVAEVSLRHPRYLRVKELFENLQVYKRVGQDIYEQWRRGRVRRIYDLCAGHGLLGLLLANRFPKLPVVCVDIRRPPAFGHYVAVAAGLGIALDNLRYVESDIAGVSLQPRSYVVSVHGCNELTHTALTKAAEGRARFAVMPCCIRDGIYFRRIKHVEDRIRYAAAAGFIAGRFGAEKITAIDERITNRNLIILGRGGNGSEDDAGVPA